MQCSARTLAAEKDSQLAIERLHLFPLYVVAAGDFKFLIGAVLRPPVAVQTLAAAKDSQLAIETAVPIGTVLLVTAISALAAYTGQQITSATHVCHSIHLLQPTQG